MGLQNAAQRLRRIADDRRFQIAIMCVIALSAVMLGLETDHAVMKAQWLLFRYVGVMISVVFVIEMLIRLFSYSPHLPRFFREPWNTFDIVVVTLSLIPGIGKLALISRVARLLLIVRLVSVSKEMRLIVYTLLRSVKSLFQVGSLLGLLIYVYAIIGHYLFHKLDPPNWGNLGASLLSVMRMVTLDAWSQMERTVMPGQPWAWLYFLSFIVFGVYMIVNLFVAVVVSNLEIIRDEQRKRSAP